MPVLSRCATLELPDGIAAPSYDLGAITPGILHIGLGGFHRAHLARYTHDLMAIDPGARNWGIVGSGLRANDIQLLDALDRQDGLYTLVERDAAGETRTLIGSIVGTIDASISSAPLLDAIVRPETRIVSITVSEHGYHLDGPTKTLDLQSAAIRGDLAEPHAPRTMPGILVEAFRRRRDIGAIPFTAVSCDNIQHNGSVLRAAVLKLAEATDPELALWIAEHARFPSSMVDRITPVPTRDEIAVFAAETGLDDDAVLFSESFRQWVIEDDFVAGRPDWDRVGAQFVTDVAPYEMMKLRLLNASHLSIAGLGTLHGYETIGETIADPLIFRFMKRLMDDETGPTLLPVPLVDLPQYKARLLERFANPSIRDTNKRVNADAPVNLLLDPIRDRIGVNQPIPLLSLGLAAWCQRLHEEQDLVRHKAHDGEDDLTMIVSIEPVLAHLGRASDPKLISAVRRWLELFAEHGVAGTLALAGRQGYF